MSIFFVVEVLFEDVVEKASARWLKAAIDAGIEVADQTYARFGAHFGSSFKQDYAELIKKSLWKGLRKW